MKTAGYSSQQSIERQTGRKAVNSAFSEHSSLVTEGRASIKSPNQLLHLGRPSKPGTKRQNLSGVFYITIDKTRMKKIVSIIACLISLVNVFSQTNEPKLKISHLTGDYYIYTTYNTYEGSKIPANGMYLITEDGVALFDTPWDTTQFQALLDSIQLRHHKEVTMCIATHWHGDRTEGLEYYKQKGIKTYTTRLTDELSEKNNKKRAEHLFEKDTTFSVGQYSFETYYPGKGHTDDNIVLWFDKEKILYGGCLIKGAEAENLGYLGDGNIFEYENTLRNVQKKYPGPKFIIVSHHDWNNINSLKHSIKLAKKLKKGNIK